MGGSRRELLLLSPHPPPIPSQTAPPETLHWRRPFSAPPPKHDPYCRSEVTSHSAVRQVGVVCCKVLGAAAGKAMHRAGGGAEAEAEGQRSWRQEEELR